MNCKPGDVAMIVSVYTKDAHKHLGEIVECVDWFLDFDGNERWNIRARDGMDTCDDCNMRPIRDNDGEDETLQWAGLPHKETV